MIRGRRYEDGKRGKEQKRVEEWRGVEERGIFSRILFIISTEREKERGRDSRTIVN